MKDNFDFQKILDQIRTKDEAAKLLFEMDILLESYFQVGEKKRDEILESKVSYASAQLFKSIIASFAGDHTLFELFLKKLKERVKALPVCTVTIAFEPRETTIETLASWIRNNLSKEAVLDIAVDPSIIGGAQIVYAGVFKDMSVRKKFDELFTHGGQEILGDIVTPHD